MPFELWCLVHFVHCRSEIYSIVYFGGFFFLLFMARANTSRTLDHFSFISYFIFW
jgi:hypothetical protein